MKNFNAFTIVREALNNTQQEFKRLEKDRDLWRKTALRQESEIERLKNLVAKLQAEARQAKGGLK